VQYVCNNPEVYTIKSIAILDSKLSLEIKKKRCLSERIRVNRSKRIDFSGR